MVSGARCVLATPKETAHGEADGLTFSLPEFMTLGIMKCAGESVVKY
jgi:hypothetical protein